MTFKTRLGGFNIYINDALYAQKYVQVKFPRSKRCRIQKKWRKNKANYGFIKGLDRLKEILKVDNNIFMSSFAYQKLLEETEVGFQKGGLE